MSQITIRSIGTEPSEVVLTHNSLDVSHLAVWPLGTEPPAVVHTLRYFTLWIYMGVLAFWCLGTEPVLGEEQALWHLSQVVLVQKLTVITLLTKPTQPMLTHDLIMEDRRDMFVWTLIALWTPTMTVVELAHWAVRVQPEMELRS